MSNNERAYLISFPYQVSVSYYLGGSFTQAWDLIPRLESGLYNGDLTRVRSSRVGFRPMWRCP